MSTINSPVDQYGFQRPDDFDYSSYENFMASYLRILARRATRWDKFMKGTSSVKKSRKVKRFVRKGIPSELRGQVWMDVSGARKRKKHNQGYYERLLDTRLDDVVKNSIITDINRTFPENIHFGSSREDLKTKLSNVLMAYAAHDPRIGYCQGLNYIAGLLLLIAKSEESAFWLLDVMMSKRLPELSTKWFICLYIDVLPVETVLRIWDSLFYEGSKILLRVAITLLSLHETKLLAARDFPQLCNAMKDITTTPSTMECHSFMTNCFEIPGSLPRRHLKKLRKDALHKLRPEEESETMTTKAA